MTKTVALALLLAAGAWTPPAPATREVTWTGWFSDKGCARVRDGEVGPNGTECVKKCLGEGAKPVFLSEQAKAVFEVRDYAPVVNDVGYRIEITGTVDDEAKTLAVKSVKRLSEVVSMCAVPRKKS